MFELIEVLVKDGDIHLHTEYNGEIVAFMRSRKKRFWDKAKREWIIPESEMENLIPVISKYEYNIKYDNQENTVQDNIPEWYSFKLQPFQHQIEGINYGLNHPKFLLADEQGLGKSAQVINLACILKKELGIKHVLIIACVNGLKYNWYEEILKHSNESPYILGTRYRKNGKEYIGSNEDRLEDIKKLGTDSDIDKHFFLITNIETLRYSKSEVYPLKTKKNGVQRFKKKTVFPIVQELQSKTKDGTIGLIAADELHKCKNPSSTQGKCILSLDAPNLIAMTGTPIMNNPIDAYLPLAWLGYERHSLFGFKKEHCIMGGFGAHQIVGYKNLDDIQATLDKCMIRRLKKDVLDLPEKIYINDYVEMSKAQSKLYDEVMNDITENIDKIKLSPNPLTLLIRLRQVTGNPLILSSSVKDNPKFDRMIEIIEDVVSNDGKAIVFSNWTDVLVPAYELAKSKNYNPAIYTGQNTKNREKEKDRFKNDKSCKVIFGTIGAMGTGLTLTEANTVIFLDEPWSRAIKDQCEDRVHRIGTKDSPNIITIMCRGTIDEKINSLVYRKGKLSDILIDKEEDIINNKKLLNYLLSIN
jgi:SNF2 family DNA or RNA helicase